MTAVNVIRQRDAVHFLTDGAAVGPDGNVAFTAPKVFALPQLRCAVAVRGTSMGLTLLSNLLSMAGSFAELRRRSGEFIAEGVDALDKLGLAGQQGHGAQVFVGGFPSSTGGAEVFVVSTATVGGYPGGTPIPIQGVCITPGEAVTQVGGEAAFFGGRHVDDLDPINDGLALLEAQRRTPVEGGRYLVGGFGQLTTVRRSGEITTRILCSWPDRIGAPIRPQAIEANESAA